MKVADQLLEALKRLGVRYLFGLPGSTEAPLLDGLVGRKDQEFVLSLHENVTVAMADGYARGGGGLGVAILHTSVGTANGISQIYNAYRDGTPLVVLAGHKDTRLQNRDGFCVVEDLPAMVRQVTKWSGQVLRPEQAVDDLYRAVQIALTPPQGPVFLSLPEDILAAELPDGEVPGPQGRVLPLVTHPDRGALASAAATLLRAQRSVMIVGDQVTRSGAREALICLAERIGAVVLHEPRPIVTSWNFPTDHSSYAGEYAVNHPAVQAADCLIAVGSRLFVEFTPPRSPQIPPGIPLIHLHPDPREVAKLYPVTVGLVGELRLALEELMELLPGGCSADTQSWAAAQRNRFTAAVESERQTQAGQSPMRASEVAVVMAELLPHDAILVNEGMRSSAPLVRQFPLLLPDGYHSTGGGALGWGFPAAVGMALAKPDRRVVAFSGDGSALFTLQALWTAARLQLPIPFIVAKNRVYLAVKAAIHAYGGAAVRSGQYLASSLTDPEPDFVHLAQGFGVPGQRATDRDELTAALRTALTRKGPSLIEVGVAEEPI